MRIFLLWRLLQIFRIKICKLKPSQRLALKTKASSSYYCVSLKLY
nr:hypothetical protein [Fusarium oxysporum]